MVLCYIAILESPQMLCFKISEFNFPSKYFLTDQFSRLICLLDLNWPRAIEHSLVCPSFIGLSYKGGLSAFLFSRLSFDIDTSL